MTHSTVYHREESWRFVCSSCNFARCDSCLKKEPTPECPSCRTSYSGLINPHKPTKVYLSRFFVEGAKRALLPCTQCDRIQPQCGSFVSCERCAVPGRGPRAVFCYQCVAAKKHDAHLLTCEAGREPLKQLRKVRVRPAPSELKRHKFTCGLCHKSMYL